MEQFNSEQLKRVNESAALAEELVSNFYKLSDSQWLHMRYDVKTLAQLAPEEIVESHFAQVVRYQGRRKGRSLGSFSYDFYRICMQDHIILFFLKKFPQIQLFPFLLYILTHELIHIVRFARFLQNFDASPQEKQAEEHRVHCRTHAILSPLKMEGMAAVLDYYKPWRTER